MKIVEWRTLLLEQQTASEGQTCKAWFSGKAGHEMLGQGRHAGSTSVGRKSPEQAGHAI